MAVHESISVLAPTSSATTHTSPWHSPVPYLYGGLAVMMGLIAFALLILACSYWNLSRNQQTDNEAERDLEAGDVKPNNNNNKTPIVFEEKYLVIMAGQQKPTFLATPSSSRTSSFGSSSSCRSCSTTTSAENEKASTVSHESVDHMS